MQIRAALPFRKHLGYKKKSPDLENPGFVKSITLIKRLYESLYKGVVLNKVEIAFKI
jgi:hypothetical protein